MSGLHDVASALVTLAIAAGLFVAARAMGLVGQRDAGPGVRLSATALIACWLATALFYAPGPRGLARANEGDSIMTIILSN